MQTTLFNLPPEPATLSLPERLRLADDYLCGAIRRHRPVRVYACFSGGHDSLTVTHWTMRRAPCFDVPFEVLHVNTGIGVEATRQFVREACRAHGWPLREECAAVSEYEQIVRIHGFPGPAQHGRMYQRLKERAIRKALKAAKEGFGRNRRALFVSGIRHDESTPRAGYKRVESRVDAQVWLNPLYWLNAWNFAAYRREHGLPTNPVVKVLGFSGECLCGAYAEGAMGQRELEVVRRICPRSAAEIDRLTAVAAEAGKPWRWFERPPEALRMEEAGQQPIFSPLCHSCQRGG